MATLQSRLYEAGRGDLFEKVNQGQSATEIAKQMFELQQQFAALAIQRMEATKPGISQIYGERQRALTAEIEPLKARYDNLLAEMTQGTRKAAASEFTRRGIPLSSGLVEQTVGARLAPQVRGVGLEKEAGLRGIQAGLGQIAGQQVGAMSDLEMAIAAVQASQGPSAITSAVNIYGQQQQSRQSELNRQLQQQQMTQSAAESQREYDWRQQQAEWEQPWQEKLWEKQLKPSPGAKPTQYDITTGLRGDLLKRASEGEYISPLISQFGQGLDISEIVELYSSVSPWGQPTEEKYQKYLNTGGVTY